MRRLTLSLLFASALGLQPTPILGEEAPIHVHVQKLAFRHGETVPLKVLNRGTEPVSYSEGPRCGPTSERKDGEKWVSQALCFNCYSEIGGGPCVSKTLEPGMALTMALPIEDSKRKGGRAAPDGIYRIGFRYHGGVAYSREFKIGNPPPPVERAELNPHLEVSMPPPQLPDSWPDHDGVTEQEQLRQCEKKQVRDPSAMFKALGIAVERLGRPDHDQLRGYVESRVMDGTLTEKQKARFWWIVRLRSRGVMNPSSRGTSQIVRAIAGTMACFGIDQPPGPDRRPKEGLVSSEPVALAKKIAADRGISFYSYHIKFIGNSQGYFAPILVTREREIVIVGTRSDIPPGGKYQVGKSRPVVVKLSPSGALLWERTLKKKGFLDFEGASVAQATDGGYVVYVLSYVHPARGASTRLVKLNRSGKTLWDHHFRGQGRTKTPFAQVVRLLSNGKISLRGHIYRTRGVLSEWAAEMDQSGKVVSESPGTQ